MRGLRTLRQPPLINGPRTLRLLQQRRRMRRPKSLNVGRKKRRPPRLPNLRDPRLSRLKGLLSPLRIVLGLVHRRQSVGRLLSNYNSNALSDCEKREPWLPKNRPRRRDSGQGGLRSKSIDEARTLLKKGRFEAAAVLVENLYKADRQDERTRALRNQIIGMRKLLHAGQVAYRSGHCGKAVKTMKRVIEVSPKLSKANAVIENCQFASPPTALISKPFKIKPSGFVFDI